MLSRAVDYMTIATWQWEGRTFLVHVASLYDRPVSVLIGMDGPDGQCADAMVPTERSLGDLIGFWNCNSLDERTRAAQEVLDN